MNTNQPDLILRHAGQALCASLFPGQLREASAVGDAPEEPPKGRTQRLSIFATLGRTGV